MHFIPRSLIRYAVSLQRKYCYAWVSDQMQTVFRLCPGIKDIQWMKSLFHCTDIFTKLPSSVDAANFNTRKTSFLQFVAVR